MAVKDTQALIVIPCYNEADRLCRDDVYQLIEDTRVDVLLVDDGSSDGTLELLRTIAIDSGGRVCVIALDVNRGKAEAVRKGLVYGSEPNRNYDVVGYIDADFATPADEVIRLLDAMSAVEVQVVMGARVARLGARIQRTALRHYLGRLFASIASIILQLPVYDTQCGAKFFVNSDRLRNAVATPFHSRWVFDVELLGRLLAPSATEGPLRVADFLEEPLRCWEDRAGSKLALWGMFRAGFDLIRLVWILRRWRHGQSP